MASGSWPSEGNAGRLGASSSPHTRSSPGRKESEQHGVRTAEKLLREFYPHTARGQTQLRLLQGLCLLATREKANVEAALGAFIEMAQAEVRWPARRWGWAGGRGWGVRPRMPAPPAPHPPRAEGQRARAAGRGAGLHAAEAGPQGAHAAEAPG